MNIIYLRIKELASDKNISLAEIERKLNLSNGIISTWKKGKASQDKISKIADYFNVSTDYLLGRTDNPITNKNINAPKIQKIARKASNLNDNDLDILNGVMNQIFKEKFGDDK